MGLFDNIRRFFGGNPAPRQPVVPPRPPTTPKNTNVPPVQPPNWTVPLPSNVNITRPAPPPKSTTPPPTLTVNLAPPSPVAPPAPPARPNISTSAQPLRTTASTPPKKPQDKTLNLDASQFAPLSSSEIKSQLAGKGSWSYEIFRNMAGTDNTWWGNRSVIPPSTDPRTQFIDRGMIGQGMTTPEEIAELHRIGDEMLRLKPGYDAAGMIADKAVQQSKLEKEALKKQKKAEAEERKRRHAAAVAQRKATDIIFLGRGVSRGLADRRANVEKLGAAGVLVLAQPADVAREMGLTIPRLRWLAFHSEAATRTHYVRFTVPKKSGGTRELAAPRKSLAAAQDWILANILEKVPAHKAAHGFVAGRSTLTNALPHARPGVLINCDLKDFFPTVNVHRVIGLFTEMGYSPAVATILGLICTESPRRVVNYAGTTFHVATGPRCLPQGASTSPAISNLVSRRMDSRLAGISAKLGFTYTRYADDLTFSAPPSQLPKEDPANPQKRVGYLLARIRHITGDEGFVVNEDKTRVQRPNTSQRVTGIVVNGAEMTVPRKTVRRLRAILHQAQKTGLAAQNKRQHPHFEAHVRGMVSYIHMINPRQANGLRESLAKVPH
ncbi:MAG TPA: reverse transcriptase family protein [Phycisphaerae bacterium]|nr:reverse transcriptase family protein [Phycisphaerae bacterium]